MKYYLIFPLLIALFIQCSESSPAPVVNKQKSKKQEAQKEINDLEQRQEKISWSIQRLINENVDKKINNIEVVGKPGVSLDNCTCLMRIWDHTVNKTGSSHFYKFFITDLIIDDKKDNTYRIKTSDKYIIEKAEYFIPESYSEQVNIDEIKIRFSNLRSKERLGQLYKESLDNCLKIKKLKMVK